VGARVLAGLCVLVHAVRRRVRASVSTGWCASAAGVVHKDHRCGNLADVPFPRDAFPVIVGTLGCQGRMRFSSVACRSRSRGYCPRVQRAPGSYDAGLEVRGDHARVEDVVHDPEDRWDVVCWRVAPYCCGDS